MSKSVQHRVELPKKDDDLVQWWRKSIDLGITWRQMTSGKNDADWIRYENYYRGNWDDSNSVLEAKINLTDYLPSNRVFPYVKALLPKIYFRNPKVVVSKGVTLNGVDDAPIVQDCANYLTRELKFKKTLKRAILNTLITGTGVVKYGYGSQYVVGQDPQDDNKRILEHASYIKAGLPWVQSIHPRNFVVPYGTVDFDDAPWCAHGVWRPLEYAQDDKNYSNRGTFIATSIPKQPRHLQGTGTPIQDSDARLWVRLWEIHDKATGELIIISDGSTKLHFKGNDPLQIEHLPFRVLIFDEDPSTMWGISSVKIMEPQQLELNDARTMGAKYRRRDFTKILVSDALNDKQVQAINDASEPLAAVRVPKPISENAMVVTTSMPRDIPDAAEIADNDMRFQIAFSRNQAGEVSTGRRTAREIEIAREASEIRNDERRDAATELYGDLISACMQISFKFMSAEMVRRITGQVWHSRDEKDLPYDLGLEINPEDARPISTMIKRADAVELYNALLQSPVINPIAPVVDLVEAYGQEPSEYLDPEIARVVALIIQKRQQKVEAGAQK